MTPDEAIEQARWYEREDIATTLREEANVLANEVERLRERVRALEKALRPFQFRDTHFIGCRRAGFGGEPHNDHDWSNGREPATACSTHCWAARAALEGK
ncbi:MAG: hypothetical protein AMXMBFR56_66310 [Polyangiaceae bacterium]